jgi:outer membrane protein OmpA-like peptidoglycan-associated protein
MTMIVALVALAFGAVAGIYLATRHFLKKKMPAWIAFLHGVGGATGFAFVLFTVVREPNFRPIRDVLYLLIATVALGVVNLLFHIRKVRHRTSLILMHGLTAVCAASMLIRAIVVHAQPAEAAPAPSAKSAEPVVSAPPIASAAPSASADTPEAPAAAAAPAGSDLALDLDTKRALERPIAFEHKSTELSQHSYAQIAEVAKALKSRPEIVLVQVQGHADERGNDIKNIELTRSRAAVVVNALVENGVGRGRLHSAGYGARCPADPECRRTNAPESCHEPSAWERDRRVVFLVLQAGKTSYRGEVACARGAQLIPPVDMRFHVPAE